MAFRNSARIQQRANRRIDAASNQDPTAAMSPPGGPEHVKQSGTVAEGAPFAVEHHSRRGVRLRNVKPRIDAQRDVAQRRPGRK